jgi:stalled ribosome rescue protein Dom34
MRPGRLFKVLVFGMGLHAAVWLDQREARVFHVDAKTFDESTLHAPHHAFRHPKPQGDTNHPEEEQRFFEEIAKVLGSADEILIVGPSTAKLQFIRFVHKHAHLLEPRIVGVETVDHPTDKQLAAYIRAYFLKVDGK